MVENDTSLWVFWPSQTRSALAAKLYFLPKSSFTSGEKSRVLEASAMVRPDSSRNSALVS